MTEYTTSSEAIREEMSSRQRTANWVRSHSPNEYQFYSPSVAPSDAPSLSSPPSEVESSHSTPPRMLLRWGDGRPDVPIPNYSTRDAAGSKGQSHVSRSRTLPQNSHNRSKSGSHSPSHRQHQHERSPPRSHSPEEIRILPSHSPETPRAASYHSRSKSLPRNTFAPSRGSILPPAPSHHTIATPPAVYPPIMPPQMPPLPASASGPQVSFSQPEPSPWHPYGGRVDYAHHTPRHQPPSIVYAPSHHSKSHYTPPAMYSYPPQNGPGGMIYSHSAPAARSRYPPVRATPYPSVIASSSHPNSDHGSRSGRSKNGGSTRDRSFTLPTAAPRPRVASSSSSPAPSETDSNESGSTYYVLPNGRQKVHIIVSRRFLFSSIYKHNTLFRVVHLLMVYVSGADADNSYLSFSLPRMLLYTPQHQLPNHLHLPDQEGSKSRSFSACCSWQRGFHLLGPRRALPGEEGAYREGTQQVDQDRQPANCMDSRLRRKTTNTDNVPSSVIIPFNPFSH